MIKHTITIAERFRGPPTSGHGGYVSGRFAELIDAPPNQAIEVTLRAPIPLDAILQVQRDQKQTSICTIWDGDTLIAEVRVEPLSISVPSPPSLAAIESAAPRSAALIPNLNHLLPGRTGFHPICFCCGPEHEDGLGVFVAPVDQQVACIWETQPQWADSDGNIPHAFLWTALDCPAQYAFLAEGIRTGLLGRMTASIQNQPKAGERLTVTAWTLEISGKKHFGGSAIFDEEDNLIGSAKTVWIGRQPITPR